MALDRVAEKARAGLLRTTIEERIISISARTGELARLTKEFKARAEAADASAASFRLEKSKKAIDSLTSTIQSLKELEASFEDGNNVKVVDQVTKAVETIQKLRNDVEAVL
jgi:hypothetical protein